MTNKEALELFYSMKHNWDKYYKLDDGNVFDFLMALNEEDYVHFFGFIVFVDCMFLDRLDSIIDNKIKFLNDDEKFNFFTDRKISLLMKQKIKFWNNLGCFYYDSFQDKSCFYRFLMFYYNNGYINESFFLFFKPQDFDYFSCYLDEVFGCKVDRELIRELLIKDEIPFATFHYIIEKGLSSLFTLKYSKIIGKDIILAIIGNFFNSSCLSVTDYRNIKVLYDFFNNVNSFDYSKFSLASKIYRLVPNLVTEIINKGELAQHIDALITMYYDDETVYYNDLGVYKKLFLSRVQDATSLMELKKIISKYLLFDNTLRDCCDYKLLLKINEEDFLEHQRAIRIFKMLYYEKSVENLKQLALQIASSKNILVEMLRFIDDVPKIYMHDTNKRLLKVKTPVYVLDGQCFNMMVHVLNGCGLGGDYRNLNYAMGSRDICMSLITDINMGLANEGCIVLGFDHVNEKNLLGMSYRDNYSDYDGYNFNFDQLFFTDVRTNTLMTCHYNEYTFRRDDSLKVSYVVCFDKIKEEEQKAASDLGVPIVLVKKVCYLQRNKKIIEELERNIIQGRYYLIPSYLLLNVQYCSLQGKDKKEYLRSVQRRIDRLLLIIRDVDFKGKKDIVAFCEEAMQSFDDKKWQYEIYRLGILK